MAGAEKQERSDELSRHDRVLQEFIKDFSAKVQSLQALVRKDKAFDWNLETGECFQSLKHCLIEPPILALPTDEGEFVLDTDASDIAIAGILQQYQTVQGKQKLVVIAYGSKGLSDTERRYGAPKKEMMAVVYFVKKFEAFLSRREFLLRTDNSAIKFLKTYRMDLDMLGRWIQMLNGFHMRIEHRLRNKNQNADALTKAGQYQRLVEERDGTEDCPERFEFCTKEYYDSVSVYSNIDKQGRFHREKLTNQSKVKQRKEREEQISLSGEPLTEIEPPGRVGCQTEDVSGVESHYKVG